VRERMSRWASSLAAPIREAFLRLTHMAQAIHSGMSGLITAAIVVGLSLALLMLRDRIGLWAVTHLLPKSHPQLAIVQLYSRMLRIVEKHGVRKPPTATASEFARLVEREWKAAGPMVADVTALYHQGRFSQVPLSQDDLSRVTEQLGRLQSLAHSTR